MKEDSPQPDQNFVVCKRCHGLGEADGRTCSSCDKEGVRLFLGNLFLYWGKEINQDVVLENKIRRVVKIIINGFLFFFGLIGLLAWIWRYLFVIQSFFNFQIIKNSFFEISFLMLIFWLSLITDLYLFYRLSRSQEQYEEVENKNYRQKDKDLNHGLKKEKKIDVRKSYDFNATLAVERSYILSRKFKHDYLEPIGLLASLLVFEKVRIIIARLEINPEALKEKIISILSKQPTGKQKTHLSLAAKKSLLQAYQNAYEQGKRKVDVTDILLAICQLDNKVADIFYDAKADLKKIKNTVYWLGFGQLLRDNWLKFKSVAKLKPGGNLDRAMTALATPFLDHFSQNLTTMAKYGYFAPCIGRDKEIEEIFRIIESGGMRNVVLIGEPGVGKTAIIEGIAQKMAAEEVPDELKDKRLMSLNIPTLIGGATPNEAQARLIQVINEIKSAGNIILVLENVRELTGIKVGDEQSLDLSEILAQALSGNLFFALATATPSDYTQNIEKNSALSGVFQPVKINEVDHDGAILILELKSGPIEYKNKVFFSYNSIVKAVELSDRFIHDQYLPDKAINILEEAAVLVGKSKGKNALVSSEDVAVIVSQSTNIPATEITKDESDKLLNLEEEIHRRIVGQDEAVKMVSASLRRARTELRSGKRPIANLLFLGPTGVGKTELAKTVSRVYFSGESNMIRIDMSEYQDPPSISRLIGASANQPGLLTEAVRKNPFSLILLDEIEKADKNILNIFLQVMDDGRLTDGGGKVIDFTNAIIIATSNAGTDFIQTQIKAGQDVETIRGQLMDTQLKQYFRPEFLNRFDGIVVFKPLVMDEVKKIARIMIDEAAVDLEKKGVNLSVTDAAVADLARAGFDPTLGARPLRRVIQEQVRDVLANYILQNKVDRRDTVVFDQGGKISINQPPRS